MPGGYTCVDTHLVIFNESNAHYHDMCFDPQNPTWSWRAQMHIGSQWASLGITNYPEVIRSSFHWHMTVSKLVEIDLSCYLPRGKLMNGNSNISFAYTLQTFGQGPSASLPVWTPGPEGFAGDLPFGDESHIKPPPEPRAMGSIIHIQPD